MIKDTRFYLTDFEDTKIVNEIQKILFLVTEEERNIFSNYVELTRHIMELDKLFFVFRYNLKQLLDYFTLYTNDLIEIRDIELTEEDYYYQINALTINLISSAKTLTESIEVCIKNFLTKKKFDLVKSKILSKPYEEEFSYRFLLHLRNYSQHGHLPVNVNNRRAYFDLDDILSMPHFELNKSLGKEINKLKKETKYYKEIDIQNKY